MGRRDRSDSLVLPSLLIVGAAKAGTTTLYRHLSEHSDVYMSPVKEPHFFDTDTLDTSNTTGQVEQYMSESLGEPRSWLRIHRLAHYRRLFAKGSGHYCRGEASTSYLYSRLAATKIRALIPDAKIVIILREPVSRAYSHYRMDVAHGVVARGFLQAVHGSLRKPWADWSSQYVRLGQYFDQVQRYMEAFPPKQLFIGYLDHLKGDPTSFFRDLYSFLDLDPAAGNADLRQAHNESRAPRYAWVERVSGFADHTGISKFGVLRPIAKYAKAKLYSSSAVRRITDGERSAIAGYFTDDIEKLSALVGRDLSAWQAGKRLPGSWSGGHHTSPRH